MKLDHQIPGCRLWRNQTIRCFSEQTLPKIRTGSFLSDDLRFSQHDQQQTSRLLGLEKMAGSEAQRFCRGVTYAGPTPSYVMQPNLMASQMVGKTLACHGRHPKNVLSNKPLFHEHKISSFCTFSMHFHSFFRLFPPFVHNFWSRSRAIREYFGQVKSTGSGTLPMFGAQIWELYKLYSKLFHVVSLFCHDFLLPFLLPLFVT